MRVTQGHVSKSVSDFPFCEQMGLTEYIDSGRPCVFFGCYSDLDVNTIVNHKGPKIVFWCGQDAVEAIFYGRYYSLKDCIHVSHLVNVVKALSPFLDIKLISPILIGGHFKPSPLGDKIFAYNPGGLTYHNNKIINHLQTKLNYEFIIGDGSVDQSEWLAGYGNELYDDCFIGLCLSQFAGGGQTIIQLGLKGRKVVTNVLLTPNAVPWKTIEEVEESIELESLKIGSVNSELAEKVRGAIDNFSWLELENYA